MVDVADERVQGPYALAQAGLQLLPFLGRQDAWHDVEGNEPLGALVLAVHGEGDANAPENHFRLVTPHAHRLLGLLAQPMGITAVVRPDLAAAVGQRGIHLVKHLHMRSPPRSISSKSC